MIFAALLLLSLLGTATPRVTVSEILPIPPNKVGHEQMHERFQAFLLAERIQRAGRPCHPGIVPCTAQKPFPWESLGGGDADMTIFRMHAPYRHHVKALGGFARMHTAKLAGGEGRGREEGGREGETEGRVARGYAKWNEWSIDPLLTNLSE
jgi:hypothetical protein